MRGKDNKMDEREAETARLLDNEKQASLFCPLTKELCRTDCVAFEGAQAILIRKGGFFRREKWTVEEANCCW